MTTAASAPAPGPEEKEAVPSSSADTIASSTSTQLGQSTAVAKTQDESEPQHQDTPTPAPGAAAATPAPAPEETRTRLQTTFIILALASALFLAALDVTIVTVAVPTIAQEFHSTAGYTWIGSAYMLAAAASSPVWGKISDIWGRKPIMLIAVGVFWVGSLLSAVSVNMGMLIVARALQGVGGGGIVILVNVCISDLFSMRKRGEFVPSCLVHWYGKGVHD
jgi:hypothetical protein